ncbi:hypothetical protein R3X26_14080 [Vibrio sp. TH_r3]|uniref:hypothetical protein n=1 Tax=Vibrio sp. TH_r3 TaxID=3082084 RepID=UPI002955D6EB|nr:hypothetical protein [Vibrio sp. TH_r3]MDV7105531.1 hypothetical protein [Vibrio sp. TH_r3]
MNRLKIVWIFSVFLVACGNDSSTNEGVFIDSAVEGITFSYDDVSGTTDSSGTFTYVEGTEVTFSVGGIVLGSATGRSFITPLSLVPGATDETDPHVVNIARFLQTLDDDDNPDNGITLNQALLSEAGSLSINFDQSLDAFANDVNVQSVVSSLTSFNNTGQRTLVSADDALEHLQESLASIANSGDSYEYGTIAIVGADTSTIGTSLLVEDVVYGREDLTNLEESVVITGRGIIVNAKGSDSIFTHDSYTEGFILSVGAGAISMTVIDGEQQFDYTCTVCNTTLNVNTRQLTFSNSIVYNVNGGEELMLNGIITWNASDEDL